MNEQECEVFEAAWIPFWYELDQPLKVGAIDDFWFFAQPPDDLAALGKLVLYRGLASDAPHRSLRCEVVRIVHSYFGELTEVVTKGLDYTFILRSGRRIEGNAEEEPGKAYNVPKNVTEWSLTVTLRRCTELA